jgi:hypothetical protein
VPVPGIVRKLLAEAGIACRQIVFSGPLQNGGDRWRAPPVMHDPGSTPGACCRKWRVTQASALRLCGRPCGSARHRSPGHTDIGLHDKASGGERWADGLGLGRIATLTDGVTQSYGIPAIEDLLLRRFISRCHFYIDLGCPQFDIILIREKILCNRQYCS